MLNEGRQGIGRRISQRDAAHEGTRRTMLCSHLEGECSSAASMIVETKTTSAETVGHSTAELGK